MPNSLLPALRLASSFMLKMVVYHGISLRKRNISTLYINLHICYDEMFWEGVCMSNVT